VETAGIGELERSGIGTGSLSPFEVLVRSGDPERVAPALAGVEGVRSTIAPADWRRDGTAVLTVIPTADANSPGGRATLARVRAATDPLPGRMTIGGEAA